MVTFGHSCNAYCRDDTHAEVIRHYASAPTEPMAPERWARLWHRELARDLGEIIAVDVAPEAERLPGPHEHFAGAYLVTFRRTS